jgi:hypothetical protein
VNQPLSWLRYVDADKVSAPDLDFDDLKVRNAAMETLGSVEGFIVDSASMRPYYVVVDSGGWFKSKDFLVPIGHAHIDDDRDALVVDISKERIDRFPGFDRSEFERLNEDGIRRMNDAICSVVDDAPVASGASDPLSAAWGRPAYRQPDWWSSAAARLDSAASPIAVTETGYLPADDYPSTKVARAPGELHADEALGRERSRTAASSPTPRSTERDRELVTARATDESPHFDGRAQPGDVLGLETGGEETHIGETSDDENRRREAAQRSAAKSRD